MSDVMIRRCDQCCKQEDVQYKTILPIPDFRIYQWITITEKTLFGKRELHLCSKSCVAAWAGKPIEPKAGPQESRAE